MHWAIAVIKEIRKANDAGYCYASPSVTKLVTVVAIFKLVEDGYIRPDEKMSKYIPQMDKEPFKI